MGELRIIIHRGTSQIGGVCTEIATDHTRIIFDLGAPLEGEGNQERLDIDGVTSGKAFCDGVFLTHYHGDHVGEIPDLLPGIPIYMGKAAKEILMAQQKYKKRLGYTQWAETAVAIEREEPIMIGDLCVTPIPSDHSAFDSLMFLIEGEDRRILLTGDFRLHGLYTERLESRLKTIGRIDLLITEGTNLTRDNGVWHDENWVRKEFQRILSQYKYVFLLASSSNLDRIAEFAKCIGKRRYMLMDTYQKELMEIRNKYCPTELRAEKITWLDAHPRQELKDKIEKLGFGMAVRTSEPFQKMVQYYSEKYPDDTCLIYSMWSGYRKLEGVKEMIGLCRNIETVHVSGHVTREDLKQMINTLAPGKLLITHTSASEEEEDGQLFPNLVHVKDEEELYL